VDAAVVVLCVDRLAAPDADEDVTLGEVDAVAPFRRGDWCLGPLAGARD
jgi:hypothetical protein